MGQWVLIILNERLVSDRREGWKRRWRMGGGWGKEGRREEMVSVEFDRRAGNIELIRIRLT
jgi:hypothetical protein